MPANKRTKFSRMRGQRGHGWGAKKKHRGSGNRGGRGMAGTGKRADQKKPTIMNLYGNAYYGKHGFHRPQKMIEHIKSINLELLQSKLDIYVKAKLVKKEGQFYVINLEGLGYQKVLGGGRLNAKLKISAPYFSESAVKKIEEKGGVIVKEDVSSK